MVHGTLGVHTVACWQNSPVSECKKKHWGSNNFSKLTKLFQTTTRVLACTAVRTCAHGHVWVKEHLWTGGEYRKGAALLTYGAIPDFLLIAHSEIHLCKCEVEATVCTKLGQAGKGSGTGCKHRLLKT